MSSDEEDEKPVEYSIYFWSTTYSRYQWLNIAEPDFWKGLERAREEWKRLQQDSGKPSNVKEIILIADPDGEVNGVFEDMAHLEKIYKRLGYVPAENEPIPLVRFTRE